MKNLFAKGFQNLLVLILLHLLLIYITGRTILTPQFYESSGQPLSADAGGSAALLQSLQSWIYLSSALYLLVKLITISIILQTALYLSNQRVSFYDLFNIVILSDFVFLLPAILKIILFPYTYPHGTLLEWHRYYILSTLSIFENAPADWSYALQSFNVFEVVYWFVLAYGISRISNFNFDQSLRMIMISYVPALLIWIAAVTFFVLLMFPATS